MRRTHLNGELDTLSRSALASNKIIVVKARVSLSEEKKRISITFFGPDMAIGITNQITESLIYFQNTDTNVERSMFS